MVFKILTAASSPDELPPQHPGLPGFDPACITRERPDQHGIIVESDQIVARCSIWKDPTPRLERGQIGYIGHYRAISEPVARRLLAEACQALRESGCTRAVGPMDGNTWHRYRFVTEPGTEPTFFLEPENPPDWPGHFTSSGFAPLASYFSALNENLAGADPTVKERSVFQEGRIARTEQRLLAAGITIRPLDSTEFNCELQRIYAVSIVSFVANFLYTPISEADFIGQYTPIQKHVDPRLVLIAEQQGKPVGYLFAIPDLAQAKRGAKIDTVIIKTVAVLPGRAYAGLGAVLVEQAQHIAHALGYRRAIHALMHESNKSLNLSGHYAKIIRRYTLFSKELG